MPIRGLWQNPASRRCDGKVAYRNAAIAEKRAESATEKAGRLIIAYECCDCGKFHIGHADKSQIIAREEPERKGYKLPTSCPHCGQPIPADRRLAAWESGNNIVYCSKKCQQKGSKKARHDRRAERDAKFTEWQKQRESDR